MIKKILLLSLMLVIAIHTIVFADYSLSDGYFNIHNPNNGNTSVVSIDGRKLVSGVNNQSIAYLINDLFTDKPRYIYKKYIGENIEERKEGSGEDTWVYKDASTRTLFYDLDGNFLYETKDFSNLYGVKGKILYSYDTKCYAYDVETKNLSTFDFDTFSSFMDDKIVFYNYRYNKKKQSVDIYDTDLNLIKSIDGYLVDYNKDYDTQKYLLLSKYIDDNKTVYNFLDADCNLLFPHDVENRVSMDVKNPEQIFIYDNKSFTYDMEKKKYIATVSEITDKEKQSLVEKLDPYYNNNTEVKEDENIKKLEQTIKSEYLNIRASEFNGKKIYIAETEYTFIPDEVSDPDAYEEPGIYVSYSNIYDSDLNILKERLKNVDTEPLEYGFVVSEDKVYDFDMKLVREIPYSYNLERAEIDGSIYFYDRVDERYNEKTSQNLYDLRFNTVFGDCENIVMSYDRNWIFVTDHNSTKMYDKELNVKKDLNRKIKAINWNHNENYMVFTDMKTDRYGIIDKDGNVKIEGLKKIDGIYKDYLVFLNGFRYGIMDYNKNIIVSLSIFDDMKEDSRTEGKHNDYFVKEVGY